MTPANRTLAGRIVRYGVAGLLTTLVYAGSVVVLVEIAGLSAVPATVVATLIVMVTSYLVNRGWVFDTNRGHLSSFSRFALATGVSIGLNTGLMSLAVHAFGWSYLAGLALTTAIVPPVNFALNYLWAFRPMPNGHNVPYRTRRL